MVFVKSIIVKRNNGFVGSVLTLFNSRIRYKGSTDRIKTLPFKNVSFNTIFQNHRIGYEYQATNTKYLLTKKNDSLRLQTIIFYILELKC